MKKLIDTLVNIWKIEDLRTRILNTLMFMAIYRLGSYVVLPGVNPAILNQSFDQSGLLGLLNMFAGGAFANASRSEEHTSELQSLMLISYVVSSLKKKI